MRKGHLVEAAVDLVGQRVEFLLAARHLFDLGVDLSEATIGLVHLCGFPVDVLLAYAVITQGPATDQPVMLIAAILHGGLCHALSLAQRVELGVDLGGLASDARLDPTEDNGSVGQLIHFRLDTRVEVIVVVTGQLLINRRDLRLDSLLASGEPFDDGVGLRESPLRLVHLCGFPVDVLLADAVIAQGPALDQSQVLIVPIFPVVLRAALAFARRGDLSIEAVSP
jgi:hypothetical protein